MKVKTSKMLNSNHVYLTIEQLTMWNELSDLLNKNMFQLQELADQVWIINQQSQVAWAKLLSLVDQAKAQIDIKEDVT